MSVSHWMLFADVESVIKVIAFLIFFVIPFISQIMGGEKGKKKDVTSVPKNRPPRPENRREAELAKDRGLAVQDFNRGKFVDGRGETLESQRTTSYESLPKSRNPAAPQRPQLKISAKETGKPQSKKKPKSNRLGQDVGDLAQQHLDTNPIREHATSLGRDVDQADERVEAHLREKFDHDLGGFAENRGEQATGSTSRVGEGTDAKTWQSSAQKQMEATDQANELRRGLLALLRTPQGLKQALLLNEILGTPKGMQDSE